MINILPTELSMGDCIDLISMLIGLTSLVISLSQNHKPKREETILFWKRERKGKDWSEVITSKFPNSAGLVVPIF